MIREILALGLSDDKERIGVKTALCSGLFKYYTIYKLCSSLHLLRSKL